MTLQRWSDLDEICHVDTEDTHWQSSFVRGKPTAKYKCGRFITTYRPISALEVV